MNFFNQLFNKSKIKMEKMTILLALHSHYSNVKDDERRELASIAINNIAESFIGKFADKPANKPADKSAETKVDLVDKNTPGANTHKKEEQKKPVEKVEKKEEKKAEEPAEEEVDETLVEIAPFYVSHVDNGKHQKKINIGPPRKFKAFTTEEAKVAANNAYPTVDELGLVFDEAWEMASAGKSNKEIVAMYREEIGEYYPELKVDSDWYGKVVNPMVANMNLLRTAFGEKATDNSVQITRPYEPGLVLTRDTDVTVVKTEAKKPAEKPVEPLKTVQTGKVEEKKDVDEEEQEALEETTEETTEETVEETTEEIAEESTDEAAEETTEEAVEETVEEERDTSKPPKVNKFADFNSLETLIFEKYREGATLAESIKDEKGRKAVLAEKRDESRMLIASAFEDEEWTEKIDGRWSPALLSYHNDIVSQISSNRANWPK